MVEGNLQHGKVATATINQHLTAGKSDISLIQEPYVHNKKVKGLSNSIGTVFAGTRSESPRTCIFVNKKFNAILVTELCSRDLTVIFLDRKIKGVDNPVMVASAYLPYDHPVELEIENRGNEPTFVTSNRREVIDMALSSPNLSTQVKNWQVSSELSASDHKWIRFKLLADKVEAKVYRDPRKTDWNQFLESLSENLG